jgi:regulator of sigma D
MKKLTQAVQAAEAAKTDAAADKKPAIVVKYTAISGVKAINDAINKIIKGATKTRDDIQNILVNTEIHYLESGDYTLINRLIQSLEEVKGFRAQGLIAHAKMYCELDAVDKTDKHGRALKAKDGFNTIVRSIHKGGKDEFSAAEKAERIAAMKDNHWFSMGPGANRSAWESLDLFALADKIIATLDRQEKAAIEAIPEKLEGEARVVWLKEHTRLPTATQIEQIIRKLDINKVLALVDEKPATVEVPATVAEQASVEVVTGTKGKGRGRNATAEIVERRQNAA